MTTSRPTPEELLARSALGDEGAFTELYDALAAPVFGVYRCLVGESGAAEDLLVDVFVEAWQQCREFDPASASALAWLMDLAHRQAVNAARNRRATSRPWHPDRAGELAGTLPTQRRALEETYYGGRTYREVARAHGQTPREVAHDLREGLRTLRSRPTSS